MRGYLIVLFILLNISVVSAATITGSIYDLDLNKVNNVILSIDSTPKQTFVSKEGSYVFTVKPGDYIIKATYKDLIANESISITDDGNYTLDLILFPNIAEEQAELEESSIKEEHVPFETKVKGIYIAITILSLAILVAIIHFSFRERNKDLNSNNNESVDIQKVLDFIKGEGGRTTQKDIRRQFGLSEAKISLMVTELEHKGQVERIKKGRANVVILKN